MRESSETALPTDMARLPETVHGADCRMREIGAGHGAFTDHVLAMGAEVTVAIIATGRRAGLRA